MNMYQRSVREEKEDLDRRLEKLVMFCSQRAEFEALPLIGRTTAHQHAASQTPDSQKAAAHQSAANDLLSLADDLAQATSEPELVKTNAAYGWAVARS